MKKIVALSLTFAMASAFSVCMDTVAKEDQNAHFGYSIQY